MGLEHGAKLGTYEIMSPIGAGGMGEVYRARDTKLGRDVAIKVLPDELAKDKDRLARFEREAKLLAQLNHPNVATLYGFEDGFLVMELVEGETLAERITRGPIPLDEALPLFIQIAEGLEAAHEKGVIHRDLKPANVKITPEGKIKILDFGLAKAFLPDEGVSAEMSQSPTLTKGTALGAIMGTASYMSPEQARGKIVDKRTDIWAFGCCLYEALTGRLAFGGDTVSDIIGAVLRAEPELEPVPAPVRAVVGRCLQKDARERLRDIGDARIELGRPSADSMSAAPLEPSKSSRRLVVAGSLALGLALGALAMRWASRHEPVASSSMPTARSVFELPEDAPLALGSRVPPIGFDSVSIAISPDGSELVYVGGTAAGTRLYRRPVNGFEVEEIPGTEGALHPFFAPDGQWVGFLTADQVKKVRLDGGAPETLANARTPVRATWTRDGVVYYASSQGSGLWYIPANGGAPTSVRYPSRTATIGSVLPDGSAALLNELSTGISGDYSNIYLLDIETLESKLLVERGYDARYVPTGHLLFARSGNILAVPFDIERREVMGDPVTMVPNVAMDSLFSQAQFAFSDNGTLVYVSGPDLSLGRLAWVDRSGTAEFLAVEERLYNVLDLSPDEQRLAVQVADLNDYIWIYDLAREEGRKLPASNAGVPLWHPNGDTLVFEVSRSGISTIYELALGSTAPPRELIVGAAHPYSWADGGRVLSFADWSDWSIGFLDLQEGRTWKWQSDDDDNYWGPEFSPDGRWVAYASDQTGQFEIWLRSFPDGETMRQVSVDGGVEPVWVERTGELFYRKANQWMATRVTLEPELSWEPPRLVFEAEDFIDTRGLSYDVSADGQRLLYVKRTRTPERRKVEVVFNWFDELERLVPTVR